jgi:lipid-A-disaccharide synthase
MKKSILVVAGETSGDNLGGGIIRQWKNISGKKYSFWGFGGKNMESAGVEILRNIDDLAVIGFWEAVKNYNRLSNYLKALEKEAITREITGAVLIDYPGFNLKAAEKLHNLGIPVYLVVSPQIWAWNFKRIFSIKKNISGVFCLYKFETELYHKENINAYFIGHPVANKINEFLIKNLYNKKKPHLKVKKIALLPGSRKSEVIRHMPFLLEMAEKYHNFHPDIIFEIPSASDQTTELITKFNVPDYIKIEKNNSYNTLATADSAVVCSGTATLECALFNLPFLLIYQTSRLTYMIGKLIIQVPYIGIVNVISGKFITKEFIQEDMKIQPVLNELENITFNKVYIRTMKNEFRRIRKEVEHSNPDVMCAKLLNSFFR